MNKNEITVMYDPIDSKGYPTSFTKQSIRMALKRVIKMFGNVECRDTNLILLMI